MSKRHIVIGFAVLAFVASGCGGKAKSGNEEARGATSTTLVGDRGTDSSTSSSAARTAGSSSTSSTTRSSTTTSGAGSSTTTTTKPLSLKAVADKQCVHPGDLQGVTLTTDPGASVGFDTTYADHTNGIQNKYGTGSGMGRADSTGRFHSSWTLAPNVPSGLTTIEAAAGDRGLLAKTTTTFTIKPLGQACP